MYYKVAVLSQNSWHADGTSIIERTCEHNHRTIAGVVRCWHQKTRRQPDAMYSTAWWHAQVRHADGTQLCLAELDEVDAERNVLGR